MMSNVDDTGLVSQMCRLVACRTVGQHWSCVLVGMGGNYCTCTTVLYGWWSGVVGNTFRLEWSYSMPGPVSTVMGDCLRAGKPSRCEACQLDRLSLLPSVGW